MLEVRFVVADGSDGGAGSDSVDRTAWVKGGLLLLEAAEAAGVEILTGCTRGMCGTDAVRIVTGAESLESPAEHEKGTIERMGLGPDHRLACSARLVVPDPEVDPAGSSAITVELDVL